MLPGLNWIALRPYRGQEGGEETIIDGGTQDASRLDFRTTKPSPFPPLFSNRLNSLPFNPFPSAVSALLRAAPADPPKLEFEFPATPETSVNEELTLFCLPSPGRQLLQEACFRNGLPIVPHWRILARQGNRYRESWN